MKDEWEKVTILDVAPIISKLVDPKDAKYNSMILIAPDHIQSGSGQIIAKITAHDQNAISGKYLVKKGDVIYSKIRPYLMKACIAPEDCLCSADMYPFSCTAKIDPRYLQTLLLSKEFTDYANSCSARTGIPKINREDFALYSCKLPPLSEQKKIAETLSVWDSAIEKTEKLIAEKEVILQWLILQHFEDPKKNKNWTTSKLSDFLKPGDKNPVANTTDYRKITIKLHKNGIEYVNSQRKMADTRPFYIRHAGELIIGKQNYFNGSIALLGKDFDGAICSNAIMSFSISESVNPEFLLEAISTEKYLREKSAYANGTGQKELSENVFLNFDVKLPSLKIQNEIMEILNLQKSELSLLNKQLAQYKKQKQGLMQKLLTGEWRIR